MSVLTMNLGAHSYPNTVEDGALAQVGSCFSLRRRVLILTASGVPAAYAQAVADACAEPHLVTLEPGEANKCPDTWLSVLRIMLKAGFDCGLTIENFNDIKEGDELEAYEMQEVKPS